MAAAVLSSGGSSSTNQLLANDILLQALKEKGTIKEIKPEKSFGKPVKADMPTDIAKYAGYYGVTNQQMKVDIKDGELSITVPMVPDYPAEKYVYTADGTFVSADGSTKVSFVKEKNDRLYLWVRQYVTIPGLGQMALSHYTAEKMEANPLSKETAAAWAKREGETFYPLNEKFTSLMYFITKPTVEINSKSGLEGYMIDKKIIDQDTAVSQHQVPAIGSRDTAEFRFYKEKGVEYLEGAGSLFVSGKNVKPLYKGKKSTVTLQADGYAKWYTVPKQAEGKTMTVTLPAQGAFAVYDEKGAVVNYSLVSGSNEVKLPANGAVVFAGAPGSAFGITLQP